MRLTLLWLLLAPIAWADLRLGLDKPRVAQFQKIEFTLATTATANNPFDPGQIDLVVEITTPTRQRIIVPAFHYQAFDMQPLPRNARGAWLYPTGQPRWKARFAPTEPGGYNAVAIHRQTNTRSAPVRFDCDRGTDPGFIRVSKTDPRYFEFTSGKPFFPIGQNVAFVTNPYAAIDKLKKIGKAGGNYARVWVCAEDWALAIEAKKSAWTRTWLKNSPVVEDPDNAGRKCVQIGTSPVRCDPSEPVALRPGTPYTLSGKIRTTDTASVRLDAFGGHTLKSDPAGKWTAFSVNFTTAANQQLLAPIPFKMSGEGAAHLRDIELREAAGGPNLSWEADTDRPALGIYNDTDAFVLDKLVEATEEAGVYLQLTLLTRNQYMNDLAKENSPQYQAATAHAKNLLRYAVARWGHSTHVMSWEYFNENNPGLPTDRFYDDLGKHLEEIDPYRHLRATSTWNSPSKDFHHPRLDQADTHFYLRPAEKEIWKDAVAAVQSRWNRLSPRVKERPFMFSEFGITDDQWKHAPELNKDTGFAHWHDAIWTGALSGFAGTPAHWFWDDIDKRDLYSLYTPFAAFASDIPWNTAHFRPANASADGGVRVLGLQNNTSAYLFLSDPRATWHAVAIDGHQAQPIQDALLTLPTLDPGQYTIRWWDTRAGKITATQTAAHDARARIPTFTRDIACTIRQR